jgi:ribosomal protein S14
MRLKTKNINIYKDLVKRKKYIKIEIKKLILKSIIQNKNVKPIIRASASYKLSRLSLFSSISKQNNNICLKTGRIKGVYNITNMSRHYMKQIGAENNLQNFKILA